MNSARRDLRTAQLSQQKRAIEQTLSMLDKQDAAEAHASEATPPPSAITICRAPKRMSTLSAILAVAAAAHLEGATAGELPPLPMGQRYRFRRHKHYSQGSIADRIRALKTIEEVRAVVTKLIQEPPGSKATRRRLHAIAEARIRGLQLGERQAAGGTRLIVTPAEARRERLGK
jgi:hypothetical protein